MRWRTPLFLGAAVLAAVAAISVFIALGAPGGDDEPTGPTPIPEALRGLGPPGTIEITTPQPLTPTPAAEAGRPDCPQGWAVYYDPDGYFSLCYPAEWRATTSVPQAYFGHTFSLRTVEAPAPLPSDGILLTMYWSEFGTLDSVALGDQCRSFADWRDVRGATLTLAGRSVPACVGDASQAGDRSLEEPPLRGTFAEIPIGPDEGYIVFFLTEAGESSNIDGEPLSSMFRSLRVGQ